MFGRNKKEKEKSPVEIAETTEMLVDGHCLIFDREFRKIDFPNSPQFVPSMSYTYCGLTISRHNITNTVEFILSGVVVLSYTSQYSKREVTRFPYLNDEQLLDLFQKVQPMFLREINDKYQKQEDNKHTLVTEAIVATLGCLDDKVNVV